MKNIILLFLTLIISTTAIFGQDNNTIASEIDEQIWKVFKQSYEARDYDTFNAIHTDDVLRVNSGGIKLGAEYKAGNKQWKPLQDGISMEIDFAFESRQYSGDVGYEVGYYRVRYSKDGEVGASYYGRFHVVLKKISGLWKITQDYDTSNIGKMVIGAEYFDNAEFLDLSNK